MLAKHQRQECGWGCPFCKREEEAAKQEEEKQALARTPIFEIMPRTVNATGLKFQAGLYSPRSGGHSLIAEFYDKRYALHAADLFTLMASPLFEGIEVNRENTTAPAMYRINVKGYGGGWYSYFYLIGALNKAADFIRRQQIPDLDRIREQTAQDHGLEGQWGFWEEKDQQ